MAENIDSTDQTIVILLGAVSGILSLAILAEYINVEPWISLVLGVIAIILLTIGFHPKPIRETEHRPQPDRKSTPK